MEVNAISDPAIQDQPNAGSHNFKARCTRLDYADAGQLPIDMREHNSRKFQLANALGLPSAKVYFKPNRLAVKFDMAITHNDRHHNPHVRYVVWEVFDPAQLAAQAVLYAKGRFAGAHQTQSGSPNMVFLDSLAYLLPEKRKKISRSSRVW